MLLCSDELRLPQLVRVHSSSEPDREHVLTSSSPPLLLPTRDRFEDQSLLVPIPHLEQTSNHLLYYIFTMDVDTFTLLPIQVDPSTKAVSGIGKRDTALDIEITALNTLHRSMIGLDTPNSVPPPPMPINPKRSQQITKLRDSGNASIKRNAYQDAIRMYSLGIEMAQGRPHWEPQGLVREELATLYANRAQAWMALREWAEGAVDAEMSLEMKKPQNPKAWWRLGKCMLEMGRLTEARDAAARGLEFEHEADLLKLKKEVEGLLQSKIRG